MFDWEHGIALHAIQVNRASFLGKGEISRFFSSYSWNLGYILELHQGWHFKIPISSPTSGLLSSYDGHFRNLNKAWQDKSDASRGEAGDQGSLSSCHNDIGIPIHFHQESEIVTF